MKSLFSLLTILLVAATTPLYSSAPRPNIVVLFADDLGYGDLSCFGHPTIHTPHLDQMASEGLRLTSFYAGAAVCSPSRAALLTGRYPIHAGMPANTGPGSNRYLPRDQILLPQVLKPAGYTSMAVGKWHLGHQSDELLPTGRGFDRFFGLPYSNDMIKPWVQTDEPLYLYSDTDRIEEMPDQRFLTVRYTEAAIDFIKDNAQSQTPFFLYLAYSMPHLPVKTPDERRGQSPAGLYGDVIQTIDWSAGEILQTLKELGIDENTIVVFTSDNGPWQNLPERMLQGGNERWHSGLAGHLRGAKGGSYEGGPRVPGIFRWPGVIPAGRISSQMASTIDLFPTLAKVAGAELPRPHALDGTDLLPFLRGRSDSPRTRYLYSVGYYFEAVRDGPWKYRLATNRDEAELYHLDRDPAEMYNVVDRYPEVAERLHDLLIHEAEDHGAYVRDEIASPAVPSLGQESWKICAMPDLGPLNGPDPKRQHIVDHGFIQAQDGSWQLWACMRGTAIGRLLYGWTGQTLEEGPLWEELGVVARASSEHGERTEPEESIQAPFFLKSGDEYYCFYNSDGFRVMRSEDGRNYRRFAFRDDSNLVFEKSGRDVMLMEHEGTYYAYSTISKVSKDNWGSGFIVVRTSPDLKRWGDYTIVSEGGVAGNGLVSAESPFVIKRGQHFYLFRSSSITGLCYVYVSENPYDFGVNRDDKLIATLPIKAPEVIEHGGNWYISDLDDFQGIRVHRLEWK